MIGVFSLILGVSLGSGLWTLPLAALGPGYLLLSDLLLALWIAGGVHRLRYWFNRPRLFLAAAVLLGAQILGSYWTASTWGNQAAQASWIAFARVTLYVTAAICYAEHRRVTAGIQVLAAALTATWCVFMMLALGSFRQEPYWLDAPTRFLGGVGDPHQAGLQLAFLFAIASSVSVGRTRKLASWLSVIGIMFTQTVAVLLAFVTQLLIHRQQRLKKISMGTYLAVGSLLMVALASIGVISPRLEVPGTSFVQRILGWAFALRMFTEQPLWGGGWAATSIRYQELGPLASVFVTSTYAEILASFGLLGVLGLLVGASEMRRQARATRFLPVAEGSLRGAMAAFLGGALIAALLEGLAFAGSRLTFIIMLALACVVRRQSPDKAEQQGPLNTAPPGPPIVAEVSRGHSVQKSSERGSPPVPGTRLTRRVIAR